MVDRSYHAHLAVRENRRLCKIALHGAMLRIHEPQSGQPGSVAVSECVARIIWAPVLALLCARLLQARQAHASVSSPAAYMSCVRRRPVRCVCWRPIARKLMVKAEDGVHPAEPGTSCDQRSAGLVKGEIGFVGLGHMGTAMAANLVDARYRVIGYVRRPDQIGRLVAGHNRYQRTLSLRRCHQHAAGR
jgi:NAD binding domain of 6-phosphogluconate dehydrogenase